jgi:hypothetical protein
MASKYFIGGYTRVNLCMNLDGHPLILFTLFDPFKCRVTQGKLNFPDFNRFQKGIKRPIKTKIKPLISFS